jgi:hypothetical protein
LTSSFSPGIHFWPAWLHHPGTTTVWTSTASLGGSWRRAEIPRGPAR